MKRKMLFLMVLSVFALSKAETNSPYITRVFEFTPAPGQFINTLPKWDADDTADSMALKAEKAIANNNKGMISLGGYGGYVVLGFDHTIVNLPDSCDFKVLGNAFWSASNPNPNASKRGGSCEPGIVMVSVDANNNGLPDDEWYELAGSEYNSTATIKNYTITYYKPDSNKTAVPDPKNSFLTDTTYIRWQTNGHGNGYLYKNSFHSQSYWPQWLKGDSVAFTGTKLANNYVDESGVGTYYVQYSYPWGYADNAPNTDTMSNMDIDWAVDKDGNKVNLTGIDFIKIYTGVNQYCGWLGETSTEVMGIEDLHPAASSVSRLNQTTKTNTLRIIGNPIQETLILNSLLPQSIRIYNTSGIQIKTVQLSEGTNYLDCSALSKGIYLLKSNSDILKFIKQ